MNKLVLEIVLLKFTQAARCESLGQCQTAMGWRNEAHTEHKQ